MWPSMEYSNFKKAYLLFEFLKIIDYLAEAHQFYLLMKNVNFKKPPEDFLLFTLIYKGSSTS